MNNFHPTAQVEEIAVIGMAGRFPGARDVQEFWQNVRDGVESISFFSDQQLLSSGVDPAVLHDVNYVKASGVLEDVELFDASFFGFTPREAEIMNPQQRVFLECAWEALERAGYDPEIFAGRIGVYAGSSTNAYVSFDHSANRDAPGADSFRASISNDKDFLTTRISYKLNLKGPSINIQTACSTSLVAVHMACQSLLNGECDMALAGGVSISVPQKEGHFYQEGGIYSPDGHCRTFDASAQGTVSGSGAGIVVLKRLADALVDGDHIHALIKGTAINNDGSTKIGYTAPAVDGQAEVIAEAQALAGVEPDTISYIEAHGTGTPLGDPIEIAALIKAFRAGTDRQGFCAIGSVKTNIGHTDAAAGVAGLIKTALALENRLLPPSLHFERPNPRIDFASSPFYVNAKLASWKAGAEPRRAGVSSFGIGGTNAHAVLEEAPAVVPSGKSRPWHLLVMSARSDTALQDTTARLVKHLKQHPDLNLADAAYTLQVGRRGFEHRRMLVCRDIEDAIHGLEMPDPRRVLTATRTDNEHAVTFLFPGQGAQYVQMAAELYQTEPTFREQVDLCSEFLKPYLGLDLRTIIYPDQEHSREASEQLAQTALTQPAVFIIEYALARMWMEWGIHPQAMIGHSIGEYVAACLAGVFSLEDALALVAARGQMVQRLPAGAMLAVPLSEKELRPLLNNRLSLAAINGHARCVVSGTIDAVNEFEQLLTQRGVAHRRLHTSHAFHSQMMEAITEPFAELVKKVQLRPPEIPYISNLSGDWITAGEATNPDYWARHLRQTVRFADGLQVLLKDPRRILLEVGPGETLSTLARQHPQRSAEQLVLASSHHPQKQASEVACMLNALGQLWLAGVQVDWPAFSAHEQRQRVCLPTYPFERKRYWLEPCKTYGRKGEPKDDIRQEGEKNAFQPGIPPHLQIQEKEKVMSEQPATTPSPSRRRNRIVEELAGLFADLLGVSAREIDPGATFVAMGADSLLLLQASQSIEKKFGIKVPFRLLLEGLSTVDALSHHIDQELPEEEGSGELSAEPVLLMQPTSSLPQQEMRSVSTSGFEQIIEQQLQIMSQQLEVLRNSIKASESVPAPQPGQIVSQTPPSGPSGQAPDASRSPERMITGISAQKVDLDKAVPSLRIGSEVFVPYQPIQKEPIKGLSIRQQEHVDGLIERLAIRTQRSKQFAQRYRPVLADSKGTAGFSLSFKELCYPLVVQRAEGCTVWDVDGNRYLDFAMGFGSLLFGHSPSFIVEAIEEQIKRGIRIGLQSDIVGEVARLICELSSMERAAFCNSGTEAVMSALRLARAVTGRSRIALFSGSYHGTFDGVLAKARKTGDGKAGSMPIAPGVPASMVEDTLVLDFGEPESLNMLKTHAHELAAVLVEPPQSRRPDLQPIAFLHALRELTRQAGIVLIFDEVIFGFRAHPGGSQALFGVRADLATYGKAIGGGLPIGVVAGKAKYMDAIDGGMWNYGDLSYPQALQTLFTGTYFQHPVLMPVTWAVLNHMKQSGPQLQHRLNERTSHLTEKLNACFEQERVPIHVVSFSSLFRFVFSPRLQSIEADVFFSHLLEKGIYAGETRNCFLSTAHTDEDLDRFLLAVKDVVREMRERGFLFDSPPDAPDGGRPAHHHLNGSSNGHHTHHHLNGSSNGHHSSHADAYASIPAASDAQEVRTLPLTEGQKELWYLAQVGADSSRAYNECITLKLRGPLNLVAMRRAFQAVINRHEALRTTFSLAEAYQRIVPTMTIDIPLVDFSASAKADVEVQEWIAGEMQYRFDLEKGPLLRAAIARLEEECHFLVITFHHIIVDGQSAGILLQELGAFYSAECQGIACHLPQPMQYSEYAQWQANWMHSPEMKEAETYWLRQFEHVDATLELPADHPRPPIKTYNGAQHAITINAPLTSALKQLSAQENTTIFATLLTAFKTLLYRLTDQRDIVVTIPMAEQLAIGADHLVGHCVNLLPLRSQVVGDPTFTDYLHKVKHTLLDALHHHAYPFIKLVENLKLVRDPGRTPLVTAAFNVDYPGETAFFDLQVNLVASPTSFAKYDLFVNVFQTDRELEVACDYNSDLFDAQTIQRWMDHLQTLLEGIVAHPDCALSDLPLLTAGQREQMLVQWNQTSSDYPGERCLSQLFEAQVERTPDAIAVVFDEQQFSYGELNARANQLAHYLQRLGVGPEALVGVALERSPELVVALLAILKAGGAYVPLDPGYPRERLAFMLQQTQAPVLLTQQRLLDRLPQTTSKLLILERDQARIAGEPSDNCASHALPQNLAYVIYTSGSTGQPKGVAVPQQAVTRLVCNTNYVQLYSADHIAQASNASFDAATFEIWGALLHGARLVGISKEVALSPFSLAAHLREQAINTLFLTTALFNQVAQAMPQAFDGVRQILFGGERVEPQWVRAVLQQESMERVQRVLHVYGPTENTTFSTWYTVQEVPASEKTIPIGFPIANTQCYVLSQQGQPMPVGVVGELYLGGDGLARGYLSRPEITGQRFVPDPFSGQAGARLYRTGDLVRWLADGSLEFVGRVDSQIKLRGYRIELGEIEAALEQHEGVREALVLLREEGSDKRLVAYVLPGAGTEVSRGDLSGYLRDKLPDYMIPSAFVALDAWPLTPNGKLDRQALPAPEGLRPDLDAAFVAPGTPVEEMLAGIWADILGIEHIGIHDNFFEIGGNSLLATRTISQVREIFQVEVPLRILFERPNIAGLAAAIAQSEGAAKDTKIQATPRGSVILDQLLMDLNQLPEHEVEALLAAEMELKRASS